MIMNRYFCAHTILGKPTRTQLGDSFKSIEFLKTFFFRFEPFKPRTNLRTLVKHFNRIPRTNARV